MSRIQKTLLQVLRGTADQNVAFTELRNLLVGLGFQERQGKGSHRIFYKEGIEEIINLQPDGSKAKPYQVKQVRQLILKYKLADDFNE
jgi:predicted RNA binding protein YcfA (HicA-like mRNA interferase family)